MGNGQVMRDLRILAVGALAYGSLFVFFATFLPRPLTWGLLFAFGWESWVPNLPGSFGRLSLMTHLRALAPHSASERTADFLDDFNPDIARPQAWLVVGLVTLLCLMAALIVFSIKEYAPREDAE
jgi:hypothetical protein